MAESSEKDLYRLTGVRSPRGSGLPHPAVGFVIGGLFGSAGLLVLGVVHGVIPVDGKMNAPKGIVSSVAGIFVLVGLLMLAAGVRAATRRARRRRVAAAHPGEPWLADQDRDRRRATFSPVTPRVRAVAGTAFFAVFLVPFNGWAFWSDDDAMMVKVITGREVEARFRRGGNAAFRRLVLVLRCIRETVIRTGTGKHRSTRTVFDVLHAEEAVLEEWEGASAPGKDVPLRFPIPAEAPATSLAMAPPVYWELEVKGEADGPDFEATFLLPVYAKPGA